jgi:hypothetical protein
MLRSLPLPALLTILIVIMIMVWGRTVPVGGANEPRGFRYPDWDDLRAKRYVRPVSGVFLIAVAIILFMRGATIPALVVAALAAISWFAVGKRRTRE